MVITAIDFPIGLPLGLLPGKPPFELADGGAFFVEIIQPLEFSYLGYFGYCQVLRSSDW
jgi:hypothetical protein